MANTFKETRIEEDLYVKDDIYKYSYELGRYVKIAVSAEPATTISLGSIIVGKNLTIDRKGVLSARTYIPATPESNGLMSGLDKAKLDTIEEGANNYTLPIADSNTLGGVKINSATSFIKKAADGSIDVNIGTKYIPGLLQVGDNLDVTNGIISVPLAQYTSEVQVNGLLTATDKKKIDDLKSVAFSGSYTDLKDTPPDAGVYRLKGSIEYQVLMAHTGDIVGDVWTISKDYTQGGTTIKAGTNYNCIIPTTSSSLGPTHWVVFDPSKSIDLTKYVSKAEVYTNPNTNKSIVYTGSWKDITDLSFATHDADGLLTKEDKIKLDGLHAVATSGNYLQLNNRPALVAIATSGDYADLVNAPILSPVATSGKYSDLVEKPTSMDGIVPVGAIFPFGGGIVPDGYLLCNGAALKRTDFPELFTAIGTKWGEPTSVTFSLPNYVDRIPEGADLTTYGTYVDAGLPNIKGTFEAADDSSPTGAFYRISAGGSEDGGAGQQYVHGFDASKGEVHKNTETSLEEYRNDVYGKSETVQPNTVKTLFIIKYK